MIPSAGVSIACDWEAGESFTPEKHSFKLLKRWFKTSERRWKSLEKVFDQRTHVPTSAWQQIFWFLDFYTSMTYTTTNGEFLERSIFYRKNLGEQNDGFYAPQISMNIYGRRGRRHVGFRLDYKPETRNVSRGQLGDCYGFMGHHKWIFTNLYDGDFHQNSGDRHILLHEHTARVYIDGNLCLHIVHFNYILLSFYFFGGTC